MKFRAICFGLVALVSLTSGCLYHRHPCWGFRLHPCQTGGGCGTCAPVCSSPIHHPILHHKIASVGSGCPSCIGGGAMINQPVGYPSMAYPPIIGNPSPLPGPTIIPSHDLPNPMPVKPSGY